MTTGGLSSKGLARVRDLLERHVDAGFAPGAVAVVARHGAVHIEAVGTLAGSWAPMAADTICRLGSMTKPVVAACAMTLVEDCTLRLDDPVDALLPELPQTCCRFVPYQEHNPEGIRGSSSMKSSSRPLKTRCFNGRW